MRTDKNSAEILALEHKIEALEKKLTSETSRLKDAVGAWRRKVEGRGKKRECLREGYNSEKGTHYKVFITDLPEDLKIAEALDFVKK